MKLLLVKYYTFSESFVFNFTHGRLDRYLRSVASAQSYCVHTDMGVCMQEVTTGTFEETVFNNENVSGPEREYTTKCLRIQYGISIAKKMCSKTCAFLFIKMCMINYSKLMDKHCINKLFYLLQLFSAMKNRDGSHNSYEKLLTHNYPNLCPM